MLRWHVQHGVVGDPEVGATAPDQRELRRLRLRADADELAAIDALDTGVRGGPEPASISPATVAYKVEN